MQEHKRIGILTSGDDYAGLNAVIRAVVHRAVDTYWWEVIGICRATLGLIAYPPEIVHLAISHVNQLLTVLTAGGTVLGTINEGNPFSFSMSDSTVRLKNVKNRDKIFLL